jgi:hypothetical protein
VTDHRPKLTKAANLSNWAGPPQADVLIYLLMLFDKLGLDPAMEAMKKIESNTHRFPVGSQPGKRRRRGA